MSRHGGGGGKQGGTENVVIGPLLTLGMLVPILGIVYCAWKEAWGRIIFGLMLAAGLFLVSPWVFVVAMMLAAFVYFRLIKEPKRDRF